MKQATRTIVYDDELALEAYYFAGLRQAFPNHFHEYYVLGLIEAGQRELTCRGSRYHIAPGAVLLLNPGDSHACAQSGDEPLEYRAFNIAPAVMSRLAAEVTGSHKPPVFAANVAADEDIAQSLRRLHDMVMLGAEAFAREEALYAALALLLAHYGQAEPDNGGEYRQEVDAACAFMAEHYAESIGLADICRYAGLSKSALLRAFTKAKSVTPYCYLENVRIGAARRLLEQGVSPVEAAQRTGFADQSHFTNYFNRFTGLTPGMYRRIFAEKKEAALTDDEK